MVNVDRYSLEYLSYNNKGFFKSDIFVATDQTLPGLCVFFLSNNAKIG